MLDWIKKNKKNVAILVVASFVIGFWAGHDYKAKVIRDAITDAFTDTFTNETAASDIDEIVADEDLEFVEYKIGETVEFATLNMKVNSVKALSRLEAPYTDVLIADEGTRFIVVDLTVTNTTDRPFAFEDFTLFDDEDRVYNPDDDAIFYVDNYLFYRELSPLVPETGKAVYKVPSQTEEFKFGSARIGDDRIFVVSFKIN